MNAANHSVATLILAATAGLAHADTIYVDVDNTSGPWNGESWTTAYSDLRDALDASSNGDGIWVAEGTYVPSTNGLSNPREATFELIDGVGIFGGFAGTESSRDQRDWEAHPTILSGDLAGNDDAANGPDFDSNGENSYHVVTAGNDVTSVGILDGFTIAGGNASGSGDDGQGGGMWNDGDPTLANCAFSGNSADIDGGGMWNDGDPTLANCTFSGNSTSNAGGGMSNGGDPALANCTFSGNSADSYGGGIYNDLFSGPTLTNCTFSGNSTSNAGGGMYNDMFSAPTLTNCTFSGNSAENDGGGGIYDNMSDATLTNCIIWGNSAPFDPQISGFPTVEYSDIDGGWPGTGNLDEDPMFVNSDGLDDVVGTEDDNLRLLPGSPCIDAGTNATLPADVTDLDGDGDTAEPIPIDLDGHARVLCERVDMGAYEFGIGDYDCDQDIDLDDYAILADCLAGPLVITKGDSDGDGDVDLDDLAAWQQCFWGPGMASPQACGEMDLDLDSDVDLADFGVFQRLFTGSTEPLTPGCKAADSDADNDVDLRDFGEFQAVFTGGQ